MTTARTVASPDAGVLDRPARPRPPDAEWVPTRRPPGPPRPEGARRGDSGRSGVGEVAPRAPTAGPRHRRPLARRRRVIEELVVLAVLLVALGATVFLLASQWLQNSTVPGAVGVPATAVEVPLPSSSAANPAKAG